MLMNTDEGVNEIVGLGEDIDRGGHVARGGRSKAERKLPREVFGHSIGKFHR